MLTGYIGLTGSPKVSPVGGGGGYLYGGQASVEGRAVDESLVETRRGGVVVVVEERFRIEGEVTWAGLTEGQALGLVADLGRRCLLEVRTSVGGEPAATLPAFEAVRTSAIELSAPLRPYHTGTGRPVAPVRYSFRSARTFTLAELGV